MRQSLTERISRSRASAVEAGPKDQVGVGPELSQGVENTELAVYRTAGCEGSRPVISRWSVNLGEATKKIVARIPILVIGSRINWCGRRSLVKG